MKSQGFAQSGSSASFSSRARNRQQSSPACRRCAAGSGAAAEYPLPGPATILYVEDNLANLDLIESLFAPFPGIRLISALQGRLGLELVRDHRPDLILLDLHLPDIPGEAVLETLRPDSRTRAIPVLVVSADATPARIQKVRAAGASEYLTKPLNVQEFLETVERLLTGSPAAGVAAAGAEGEYVLH